MSRLTLALIAGGVVLLALAWLLWRRGVTLRVAAASAAAFLALLALACGGYNFWYHHRPQPEPARRALFTGVTYIRDVRTSPRPLVIHVVAVDLDAPGIGFLVTPAEPREGRQLRARTTSQFLGEFGVQIAINGSFFQPWFAHSLLHYYPHVGDPVDVYGLAVSGGRTHSPARNGNATLAITEDNRATIGAALDSPHNALSGGCIIVKEGVAQAGGVDPGRLHPRTAVGLDATGRRLLLAVVDGRQPNYSEGVTLAELAGILLDHGAHRALNLDGGGSSTLVVEGPDGRPQVLNSPIHGRVPPGIERPVANHLGVLARRPTSRGLAGSP